VGAVLRGLIGLAGAGERRKLGCPGEAIDDGGEGFAMNKGDGLAMTLRGGEVSLEDMGVGRGGGAGEPEFEFELNGAGLDGSAGDEGEDESGSVVSTLS
jgi:hypothetical protein